MSRMKAVSVWMLPLLILVLSAVALGQNTASIKGTITDPSGAAIVGAKVTARGPLGIERTSQTKQSAEPDSQRNDPHMLDAGIGHETLDAFLAHDEQRSNQKREHTERDK